MDWNGVSFARRAGLHWGRKQKACQSTAEAFFIRGFMAIVDHREQRIFGWREHIFRDAVKSRRQKKPA